MGRNRKKVREPIDTAFRLDRHFERLITGHRMRLSEPKTETEELTRRLNNLPEGETGHGQRRRPKHP